MELLLDGVEPTMHLWHFTEIERVAVEIDIKC